MRKESALAYLAVAELEQEADDELDLLEEQEDICPTCGSLLIEQEDDFWLLHCPVCDRLYH